MDHGSIGVLGPLRRPVTHWVEGVIDTFAKPITHADKPTCIVIAVLDPVAISRGHLQQIANFVVGILSRRRVYGQAGKPALRGVAECRHNPIRETLIYSKIQLLPPDKSRPPERCRDEKSNKSAPP